MEQSISDKLYKLGTFCSRPILDLPDGPETDTYWGIMDGLFQKRVWNFFNCHGSLNFIMTPPEQIESELDEAIALMAKLYKEEST